VKYNLNLNVESKDVRHIVNTAYTIVVNRFYADYQELLIQVTNAMVSGNSVDILKEFEKLEACVEKQAEDLENLSSMIIEIDKAEFEDGKESAKNVKKAKKKKQPSEK
tara:strand:+ start:85 stop:408 length:324 start_codon:yes stop_codon:yes gene_type:complete